MTRPSTVRSLHLDLVSAGGERHLFQGVWKQYYFTPTSAEAEEAVSSGHSRNPPPRTRRMGD